MSDLQTAATGGARFGKRKKTWKKKKLKKNPDFRKFSVVLAVQKLGFLVSELFKKASWSCKTLKIFACGGPLLPTRVSIISTCTKHKLQLNAALL